MRIHYEPPSVIALMAPSKRKEGIGMTEDVKPRMRQMYESEWRRVEKVEKGLEALTGLLDEGRTVEIARAGDEVAIEVWGELKGLGKTVEGALEDLRRRR